MIIEDTVAAKSLIQTLKKDGEYRVINARPIQDKYTRFAITSPSFEMGKIYLPEYAPWLMDFENELLNFPDTKHDDQVDSVTQFLAYADKLVNRLNPTYVSQL